MTSRKGKILVIRGGAIGDFILTLPVFAALREQFPETQVDVLGYAHIAQLAVAGGLVDEMQSIEARALAGFFARNGTLDPKLGEYFASYAVILSYLFDPDKIFQENVARCSKAQFIVGPHRPDEKLAIHATQVFLKPLERLAIFDANPVPRLQLKSTLSSGMASAGFAPTLSKGNGIQRIALHPGSGSEKKNWPEARWERFIKHLVAETDLHFLLTGGEAEGDRVERLGTLVPAGRLQMAKGLPLRDLAQILQQCFGFVGHDSGITHLATAVGLSGLVLWGETDLDLWRPLTARMRILKAAGRLADLPEEQVFDETMELLKRVAAE